jgi:hypothetical protein
MVIQNRETRKMELQMTKQQAQVLAKREPTYRAKQRRDGTWVVWDQASDHVVEFDRNAPSKRVGLDPPVRGGAQ